MRVHHNYPDVYITMVRGTHTRKRSRPMTRKRRTRSTRKRGRRSSGLTSKSGTGGSFGFRARRISRRSWNHKLWDSTLQKQHVRSNFSTTELLTSGASANLYASHLRSALTNTAAAQFWTAAGGALPIDTGIVPVVQGDLVIRGGMIGIKCINAPGTADPINVSVFLIKVGDEFDNGLIPATTFHGWDPTVTPEFNQRLGRIVLRKTFLIENGNVAELKYRLPITKIDGISFTLERNQFYWFIQVNSANVGDTLLFTRYHNLSFSADFV